MKTIALAFVATLGLLSTSAVAQNLITNGSFESPVVSQTGYTEFPVGDSALTGWTVFGPSGMNVAVVGGSLTSSGVTFPAQDGVQWLDLSGTNSRTTEGVQQSVTTIAGRQYQLSFYIGNTTGGGVFGSTSTVEVLVDGTVAFTDTNSTVNATSLTWQQYSHAFVATGSTTTIGFRNADPASDDNNSLDNVVLTEVSQAPTTTTLSPAPNPATVNQTVVATVTVSAALQPEASGRIAPAAAVVAAIGGTANVSGGGASCVASLTNGVGSCTLVYATPGSYTLTAAYAGDAQNAPSSGTASLVVNAIPVTTATVAAPTVSNAMLALLGSLLVIAGWRGVRGNR